MSNDSQSPFSVFRGNEADFQHSSDDSNPAVYTAVKRHFYQCGKCFQSMGNVDHWPARCSQGHKNEKPSSI